MSYRFSVLVGLMSVGLACSKQATTTPLAETLDRLRTLGVATNPVVPEVVATGTTAKSAVLTLFAAVPSGQEASLTGLDTTGAATIAPSSMTIAAPSYEEHAGFRLAKFEVTVQVPNQAAFSNRNSNSSGTTATDNGSGTAGATALADISSPVSYRFALSSGDRTETADGTFLVAGTGNSLLSSTAPTLSITAPAAGATISDGSNDLKLEDQLAASEGTTVAWFVSSGAVKNRRNAATTWVPGKGTSHSAVATVRTNRTFGFAIQIIDVVTE